jgi:pimeloyl-ACP methyl ester carboxylesterase
MPFRHCTRAVLPLLAAAIAADASQAATAQQPPASTTYGYTVFVGGTVAGREDVTVQTAADGITITGKGRLSGTLDIVMRRAEVRYRSDWTPEIYELEAVVNGGDTVLQTTFAGATAVTKGVDGGEQIAQTDTVPPQVLVLPNVFFGSYEALARRLMTATGAQEFTAFIGGGRQATLRLAGAGTERMQIGTSTFTIRRYALSFAGPRGVSIINIYADENGTLLRVTIPAQAVDVMRDDLASATSRTVVYSNPTDEAVNIPAAGFNLGATLTWPASLAAGRRGGPSGPPGTTTRVPAVVLLAGAAANERDGVVAGVPLLGQLAGALADAGFLAVRYDKRGYGQSGGRAESATLGDYAEDALAVVRWLGNRRDVDRERIAVVGHNEGAWAALLAAARERRIAGAAAIAASSTTGAERNLEQQRHELDRLNLSPAERVAKIELQTRINSAVVTGRGWENIPADMRKAADTPWFQSFLSFDPARVVEDIRQPLLFVHGEIDDEVPVSHADRLGDLARKEGRSRSVAVVIVRGVNHLLIPAFTGDVGEYPSLKDRNVSKDVTAAINGWLTKTFAAIR